MRRLHVLVGLGTLALIGCRQSPPAQSAASDSAAASGVDRRDELLLAAAKVALPPAGIAAADLPDPASQGAQLVARYCAQCHELPSPLAHSATDWPSVARRMWLRTEYLPPSLGVQVPNMSERYVMLEYLTTNALKVSGSVLPEGRGRAAFAEVCSRCHALPDPRVHSAEDWPTVVVRMERNMERMRVPPAGAQTADVLLYLQTAARPR